MTAVFLMSIFVQRVEPIERETKDITPLETAKSDKKKTISGDKYKDDIEALEVFHSQRVDIFLNV